jgi:hypothetical protein
VLHRGQIFVAGPGDGEQEGGVVRGHYVMPYGGGEGKQGAGGEIMPLAVHCDGELALQDLHGESAVGVVLVHVRADLHGDEHDAEVVLFEESLGVDAGWPGFLAFGLIQLLWEIELRDFVDHGAVLQGGSHGGAPFRQINVLSPGLRCDRDCNGREHSL